MDETPNLGLPYIMAAQSQKHVTHNEAIRALDAIVQLSVLDRDLSAPPGSPADGARYIVGESPTGAWSGHGGKIAAYQDGAWMLYAPVEGWIAWVADEEAAVVWSGSAWVALAAGEGGGGEGGAPADAEFIVKAASSGLSAERVLTDTATVTWDYATGGQAKANVPDGAVTYAKLQDVSATDKLLGRVSSGAGDVEEIACTAFGRSLLEASDAAGARTTLGLAIGSDVQAFHAFLADIAALEPEDGDSIVWNAVSGHWEADFVSGGEGGEGGGEAPTDAEYVVKSSAGGLSAERVLTNTASLAWDWDTGGQAKGYVQVSGPARLLGRKSSGAGAVEELSFTDIFGFADTALQELLLSHSLLALQVADLTNTAIFTSANRVADSFDALTYVDTGGATNLDTGSAGVLKPASGGATSYANAGGQGNRTGSITVSSSYSLGGGTLSNLVDGGNADDTSDAFWMNSTSASGNHITFDFGSAKYIDEMKFFQSGDWDRGTYKVQHSPDNSNWTDASSTFTLGSSTTTITVTGPALRRYWRLLGTSGSVSGSGWWREFEFKLAASAPGTENLTVRSAAFIAASAPAAMKAVIRVKEVDAADADTDYTFEFSRDDGANWELASLSELFTVPGSIRVCETGLVDVSGQPSDTDLRWRFKTANSKMIELHDVLLYWQ